MATTTTFTKKTITCLTCEQPFAWTAEEQQRYRERNWDPPRRCEKCRELLRRQRERDRREADRRFGES